MIAIIGSGGIAEIHIQALSQIGRKPNLIYNKTKRGLGDRYGVPETDSWEALLRSGCDSFHICTPPDTHRAMIDALLDAEIPIRHLFCEKPLADTPEDAVAIRDRIDSARAQGRPIRFATGFNIRFYPAVAAIRDQIQASEIGAIRFVHASYFQEFHVMPEPMNWRYRSRMRAMTEIGSHLFDLVRFLTAEEIDLTSADFSRPHRLRSIRPDGMMQPYDPTLEREVVVSSEDAAVATGRLRSGGLISLAVSETAHGRKNKQTIEIIGECGSYRWDSESPMQLLFSCKGKPDAIDTFAFDSGFQDTFAAQFRNFYQENAARCATLEDGVANAMLCESAYQLDPGTRADRIAAHYQMELIPEERVFVHVVARSSESDESGRARYNSMLGMHSNAHGSFSRFHKLDVDETWHYYEGEPFRIVLLVPDAPEQIIEMGPRFDLGQRLSFVVPKGTWFASELLTDREDAYALFGCTLAPAFEEDGFEGGYIETLLARFPQSGAIIRRLAVDGEREHGQKQ